MRALDLFSGIGGFSLAFERAGFSTVAFSEIEKFPCRVLAHHWPDVPNLGDVTKIDGTALRGQVDVVTFGSPCQDLSVAGKRKGLVGERSGLFYEAIRIIAECRPRFAVWENVPGAFSSNKGHDFAAVLDALADIGAMDIAWAVLDAQWFGVPQRRRRVFVVADFGGERAGEILAECEGLRGHPAPRREAREGVARCIGTRSANGSNERGDGSANLIARYLTGAERYDAETETLVAHALRAEGFDASEDGTGRGTPLVPVGFNARQDPDSWQDRTGPLDTDGGTQAVAFTSKDYGADAGDIAPTLRAMPHDASHANGGGQVAVAFAENSRAELRLEGGDGQRAGSLSSGGGKMGQGVPTIAMPLTANYGKQPDNSDTCAPNLIAGMGVRRLTPRECERLQGFPDNHTNIPGAADGPRYRALGNSVAVPVVEWIAHRVAAALRADRRAA